MEQGKVVGTISMSLDGFVADPFDRAERLFGWHGSGEVVVPSADPRWVYRVSEASAAHLRDAFTNVGALLSGRRLFDLTAGWGGSHPMGVPVFVVTHTMPDGWPRPNAPFTFVTDGIESALAQARTTAGDKMVAVASAALIQQYLNAGLLDELRVDLVPVLLGRGVRLFDNLDGTPLRLHGPRVIQGTGVTHLYYDVKHQRGDRP
jgi:dihydrofolate reductase